MMVLKWLRQTKKLVLFRQSELDQHLLAAVKAELDKQPGLSFSSLCKEALHQLLLGNHAYPGQPPSTDTNKRIESLEAQLLTIEQRFFAQEKNRLERLEAQLAQLSLQVAHLASGGVVLTSPQPVAEAVSYPEDVEEVPEDPVLSRLSGLIDDF